MKFCPLVEERKEKNKKGKESMKGIEKKSRLQACFAEKNDGSNGSLIAKIDEDGIQGSKLKFDAIPLVIHQLCNCHSNVLNK